MLTCDWLSNVCEGLGLDKSFNVAVGITSKRSGTLTRQWQRFQRASCFKYLKKDPQVSTGFYIASRPHRKFWFTAIGVEVRASQGLITYPSCSSMLEFCYRKTLQWPHCGSSNVLNLWCHWIIEISHVTEVRDRYSEDGPHATRADGHVRVELYEKSWCPGWLWKRQWKLCCKTPMLLWYTKARPQLWLPETTPPPLVDTAYVNNLKTCPDVGLPAVGCGNENDLGLLGVWGLTDV